MELASSLVDVYKLKLTFRLFVANPYLVNLDNNVPQVLLSVPIDETKVKVREIVILSDIIWQLKHLPHDTTVDGEKLDRAVLEQCIKLLEEAKKMPNPKQSAMNKLEEAGEMETPQRYKTVYFIWCLVVSDFVRGRFPEN